MTFLSPRGHDAHVKLLQVQSSEHRQLLENAKGTRISSMAAWIKTEQNHPMNLGEHEVIKSTLF